MGKLFIRGGDRIPAGCIFTSAFLNSSEQWPSAVSASAPHPLPQSVSPFDSFILDIGILCKISLEQKASLINKVWKPLSKWNKKKIRGQELDRKKMNVLKHVGRG